MTGYIQRQDCFYCSCFKKVKKLWMAYNELGKPLLLSGDVESNPGSTTNASNVFICSDTRGRGVSDFLFNYRLLRHSK